jgi:glutamyl-tRNA synthetase
MPEAPAVRVRIAPSPTGDPHVGTAYIALLNYIFARQRAGKFVLRIEDTDRSRFVETSERMIFDSLRWLGLQWDEGPDVGGPFAPYRQSERTELYRSAAERLLSEAKAYRCFCTPEQLEEMRRQQSAAKLPPRYDRRCRRLAPAEIETNLKVALPFTIRMAVPETGSTTFRDELRGDITFDHNNVDDQVLIKSDGYPTYHLANVVDDHEMLISDVIRAEEWISSTPKHVLLYAAFGWGRPRFWHMPLLRNADRSKISKRKNPVSLIYYREAGFLPRAMINFLGLLGGGMPADLEKFTLEEMVEKFEFERISLGGPVFDLEKLKWLNGVYLRALSAEEFGAEVRNTLLADDYLARICPLVQERIETLPQFFDLADFFFREDVMPAPDVFLPKKHALAETVAMSGELLTMLETCDWSHESLEQALRAAAAAGGWSAKEVFMLVRAVLTGKTASPPLLESMVVFGRARSLDRMRRFIEAQKKSLAAQPPEASEKGAAKRPGSESA